METYNLIDDSSGITLLNPAALTSNTPLKSVEMQNEFNEIRNHYHSTTNDMKNRHCYWCHHPFDSQPVYCPIRLKDPKIKTTYVSGINKETYSITEHVTLGNLSPKENQTVEKDHYEYLTDGIFCSFNCCLAYIQDNTHNPLYNHSKNYLHFIYNINKTLIPAPHWKMLQEYGGPMTIDNYRRSFDHLEITHKGFVVHPITSVFEENIRL